MLPNRIYILQKGIEILDGYTSLTSLCDEHDLPYRSIMRGKMKFVKDDEVYVITVVHVKKIKGRGRY